jgi:hypothetical protein
MKIIPSAIVSYMKGKAGSLVYSAGPGRKYTIARTYNPPTLNANHHLRGAEVTNIGRLWRGASSAYKNDFKIYYRAYCSSYAPSDESLGLPNSPYPLFVKACYAWRKRDPIEHDLVVVTGEDMYDQSWLNTVSDIIDDNYLPSVPGYATLDNKAYQG